MNKVLLLLLTIGLLITTAGCELIQTDGPNGNGEAVTAEPSEIAASEADSYPQSQEDAVTLYTGAMALFNGELQTNTMVSSYATKAVTSETLPFDWSGSVGDGSVDITGIMTSSYTGPDEGFIPEANTVYEDIQGSTNQISYQGTIDGATLNGIDNSFTLNGQVSSSMSITLSLDVSVGSEFEYAFDVDMTLSIMENHALSILRDDGLGAKIFLYYSAQYNQTDIDYGYESNATLDVILAWLESTTVNMKIYNDANELIGDYHIPVAELTDVDTMLFY